MSSAPTLGPIAFESFEVPEQISLGGKQKLVVHAMPGGGRVVDAMGADDAPIKWSGIFSGSHAAERARSLDRLRKSGLPLLLQWDGWRFRVIIHDFEAHVTNSSWIPYRIELCVLPLIAQVAIDYLIGAVPPLTIDPGVNLAAIDQAIAVESAGLGIGTLAAITAASGRLADYVTQRAYAGSKK